jgi:hypothetical protein
LFSNAAYQRFKRGSRAGGASDFIIDAVLLPSPYAYSFGSFLSLATSSWFAAGGVISSVANWLGESKAPDHRNEDALADDMSTTSLIGGGLIAGDALAALGLGVLGLLATIAG